jgi:hypothetical protein
MSGWSPSAAQACTVATVNRLPINGGSYDIYAAHFEAGSTYTARARLFATFANNGTYTISGDIVGSPYSEVDGTYFRSTNGLNTTRITLASGRWLPSGRSASDFTISMSFTPSYARSASWAYAGSATTSSYCDSDPDYKSTSSVSASGSQGDLLCLVSGGHVFMRTDPTGQTIDGDIRGNINITLRDNRYGVTATTVVAANVADGY